MPVFSLYLHVPFCAAKCGYCSFYSRVFDHDAASAWLDGVALEADRLAAVWGGKIPVRTAYAGGGTPSALPLPEWRRLILTLEGAFDFSALEEFTVEANPCSLTDGHLALWTTSRVTRVSLGVQSMNDAELAWLGRLHDAEMAARALDKAVSCGLDVSADLMFGMPQQTLRTWRDSLRFVTAAGAGHVSTYQLTLSPGTPLWSSSPSIADGYSFYRFAQWYLGRKGLEQYEIASFARPGKECRHNTAYWRQENVLALGPSAWGYLEPSGLRYRNAREEYSGPASGGLSIAEAERLEGRARGIEAAILALRTRQGIHVPSFAARFGDELANGVMAVLKEIPPRLTRFENESVSLSQAGMRVGNAIWTELLALED